jgi:triosephosphate isomerase
VHYVIIGHSERRHIFHEDLNLIRDKVAAAIRNEITPLLCVGETKQERKEGETKQVLHDQLMTALSNLTAAEVGRSVVSYEPVWAIGTGDVAKPDQVEVATNYIRNYVKDVFGPKAARNLRILYGGSVVPDVIHGFLDIPGVDGFLVGGASLNYDSFAAIISASRRWQRDKGEGEN